MGQPDTTLRIRLKLGSNSLREIGVTVGCQLARDLPVVREVFQRAFADLDAGRDPSQAHRELARLIHEGRVQFVISYNWDSCLERAYQGIYGTPLPVGVLIKPHGDVLTRDHPWTFPDEDRLVPQTVLDGLVQLDDRPRTLLVLGYSGCDQSTWTPVPNCRTRRPSLSVSQRPGSPPCPADPGPGSG